MPKPVTKKLDKLSGWDRVSFCIFAVFLGVLALGGGSSRSDVQSLPVYLSLSVFLAGYACIMIKWHQIREYQIPLLGFLAFTALLTFQLVPLGLATGGSHAQVLAREIGAATAVSIPAKISLSASATWNALMAVAVPIAVMLLCATLSKNALSRLLPVMLCIALLSAAAALLQIVGGRESALYLYRITNEGAPVGLLANRNHQSILLACIFPMVATFATLKARSMKNPAIVVWSIAGLAITIIPLLLMTGSRAGILAAVVGITFVPLLYRTPDAGKRTQVARPHFTLFLFPASLAVLSTVLIAITIFFDRAEAFRRLFVQHGGDDSRWYIWQTVWTQIWQHWPFGTGFGTFPTIYQLSEPSNSLEVNYVNQAHNDWLDVFLTTGAAGAALLIMASLWIISLSFRAWTNRSGRTQIELARLGSVLILILGAASVADYPLRTPLMTALFLVAVFWLAGAKRSTEQLKEQQDVT